jgi:required for meiotic nuclear division protein 1
MAAETHTFFAIAFEENLSLKELAAVFPGAQGGAHELRLALSAGGEIFLYPFGAVVFRDVPREAREAELARLRAALPRLTTQVVREDFTVREEEGSRISLAGGVLIIDRLTPPRAGIVAQTVAQSAAMEYYERIVEALFTRTAALVSRLETRGTVSMRTRPLHRFIGEAVSTRSEVLSILHLLDKPDAVWEDPAMDRIYEDLREEFDLADRYQALESKLRSVQEALELVLDVARDRRLVLLESAIVVLIVVELVLSLLRLS